MPAVPNSIDNFLNSLEKILSKPTTKDELYDKIVNAPFSFTVEPAHLFLGIIVLVIKNELTNSIDRVALSQTELAKYTLNVTTVPFNEIKIPIDNSENIIAKAMQTKKPQNTTDWKYLFVPALAEDEARINQAGGGIATSYVYPIETPKLTGALIFSYFQYMNDIGDEHEKFMKTYTAIVSSAFQRVL